MGQVIFGVSAAFPLPNNRSRQPRRRGGRLPGMRGAAAASMTLATSQGGDSCEKLWCAETFHLHQGGGYTDGQSDWLGSNPGGSAADGAAETRTAKDDLMGDERNQPMTKACGQREVGRGGCQKTLGQFKTLGDIVAAYHQFGTPKAKLPARRFLPIDADLADGTAVLTDAAWESIRPRLERRIKQLILFGA